MLAPSLEMRLNGINQTENPLVAKVGKNGFIPFGVWNDKRLSWVILALMGLMLAFWIFINLRIR